MTVRCALSIHPSLFAQNFQVIHNIWVPCIWVPWKFSGVPDYGHGYTFSDIFNVRFFRLMLWICVQKVEVLSFTRSWDKLEIGQSLHRYAHAPFSPKFHQFICFNGHFNGLLFGWTLWMFRPNLKFVPEIIGGTQKLGSPWIHPRSHTPFTAKLLMGFCLDGPWERSGYPYLHPFLR